LSTQTNNPKPLHKIFTDVPPHYDTINRIFTGGMDKKWRLLAARECLADKPKRVLDLACGTGDLAVTLAEMADYPVEVTGLDFSEPMLEIARWKAEIAGKAVTFIEGDAANLPFPDDHFDCVGISFAFRNLTYRHANAGKHIAEVLRVLHPGGKFVIVESSQPKNWFIRKMDHLYVRTFVYWMGWWISGNRNAYRYLGLSAANYYTADELKDLLLKSGFSRVSFQRLFCGAAAIHIAIK
jgi:demethylmenaquinone methyltransferase/2-methoxy-6-polyprenyl-1,4-benzoquinol methylase